jgi:hypothetical protein
MQLSSQGLWRLCPIPDCKSKRELNKILKNETAFFEKAVSFYKKERPAWLCHLRRAAGREIQ